MPIQHSSPNSPNNTDKVAAAYGRLVAALTQYSAQREIVQAVASNNTFGAISCFLCGQPTLGWTLGLVHTSDCPVTKARALLACETKDGRAE